MNDSVCITFNNCNAAQQEVLIALLNTLGFDGFEQEEQMLRSFISEEKFDQPSLEQLMQPLLVTYSKSIIPVTNWNEKWEADFEPVTVLQSKSEGIFANIRAHFHPPIAEAAYEVIITPKMSFGTGHHATTYGMIECMGSIDFSNKSVIDFGTGTGVLAILAEKMGAAHILAIDNDEWSISNTKENIQLNHCKRIEILQADSFTAETKADIILANINLNVIVANLEMLRNACNTDSVILFSGMLTENKPVITAALHDHHIIIEKTYERNNWIVLVCSVKH